MNDFTASNGVAVRELPPLTDRGPWLLVDGEHMSPNDAQALREFFQAEADGRLGRWRWPADPDFVVYEPREQQPARVLRESTGQTLDYLRSDPRGSRPSAFGAAAHAYFDAHPDPKPWHEAVGGEVWILMFQNSSHAWFVNGDYFQSTTTLTNILKIDEGIIAGRRIFPDEVES